MPPPSQPLWPQPLLSALQFPRFVRVAAELCDQRRTEAEHSVATVEFGHLSAAAGGATVVVSHDGTVRFAGSGFSEGSPLARARVGHCVRQALEPGCLLDRTLDRIFHSHQPDGCMLPNGTGGVLFLPLLDPASHPIGVVCVETRSGPTRSDTDGSLYRALFDLLPSSVVLLDLGGWVRDVNPAFCRWMGYSREELVGTHVARFSIDPAEKIEQNLARLRAGETLEHEVVNRQKDGSLRHYEIRERAVDLPDGTRGILIVSHDITDRKVAEAERLELERGLLRAQKLESLGVLAGGIAHDFNNLLTVVFGHLDLATQLIARTSPAQESLQQISLAARRAADLTRQMLAYSGRGRFVVQPVNLALLLADTIKTIQASFPRNIDLQIGTITSLPAFQADAAQIVQVLKNLLLNAAESMPESGGSIHVQLGMVCVTQEHLPGNRTDLPVVPGRFVTLEVADTGAGMTDEVRQRMFDPFFSTKFAGRGLGLAAVLGIIRSHGGAMFVDSVQGRGTTVRIFFPAPENAPGAILQDSPVPAPPVPDSRPLRFVGTVLLAEDEDGVRELLSLQLRSLGLEVVSAPNGEIALEFFSAAPQRFSFALLDLTMPGMSGIETLARLREIRPDLKAVLTSGYQRETIKGCQDEDGFIDFVPKPCDSAQFHRVIRGVCTHLGLPRR